MMKDFSIMEFLSLLFGLVGATWGTLVHYKSKKREADANAGKAESEVEGLDLEHIRDLCELQGKKLVELQEIISKSFDKEIAYKQENVELKRTVITLTDEVNANIKKINELKQLLSESNLYKCIDTKCPKRKPAIANVDGEEK